MKTTTSPAISPNLVPTIKTEELVADVRSIACPPSLLVLGKSFLRLSACVAASSIAAWSLTSFLYYGFDCGYRVVQLLAGQPDSPQAMVAGQGLAYLALPATFALVLGFLKVRTGGHESWLLAILAMVAGIAGLEFAIDMQPANIISLAPWVALATVLSLAAWLLGKTVASELSAHSDSLCIVAPALAMFLPAGIFFWAGEVQPGLPLELAFYFVLVTGSATVAAFIGRGKHFFDCLTVAALALSPLLLCLMFNVGACLVSLYLDIFDHGLGIGWRALLSASLLSFYTATAICLGAGKADWLNRTIRS